MVEAAWGLAYVSSLDRTPYQTGSALTAPPAAVDGLPLLETEDKVDSGDTEVPLTLPTLISPTLLEVLTAHIPPAGSSCYYSTACVVLKGAFVFEA